MPVNGYYETRVITRFVYIKISSSISIPFSTERRDLETNIFLRIQNGICYVSNRM